MVVGIGEKAEAHGGARQGAAPEPSSDLEQSEPESRTEIEAAVFRRLVAHLRNRADVQNIDMMNLAGFCRNCLSRWYEEEARERGVDVNRSHARGLVYGMPYEEWKRHHQKAATPEQQAAFDAVREEEAIA